MAIDYREEDRRLWEEELEPFVPRRLYDAHCHLPKLESSDSEHLAIDQAQETLSLGLREWLATVFPNRETHFLLLAHPFLEVDVEFQNRMLGEWGRKNPRARIHCLATPDYSVRQLKEDVKRYGFQGLKVYRTASATGDINQCRIHEFLTHEQMELANELRLWITLHVSRSDGVADTYNLKDLEEYTTRRYPNIRWILAHCGRSFTYYPIQEAVERLRELPNIWYDLSAVTDVRPFVTLFQKEDLNRLFYGSDSIDAVDFHGKYVTLGRSWQMLNTDKLDLDFAHCEGRPVLALYEQLLAMKHAAEIVGLSRAEIDRLFWGNAAEAFDLKAE